MKMECVSARIPYTTWRLHAFRQLLATSYPRTAQTFRRGISTSRETNQPHEASPETKSRQSNTNSTPPSQRLPQSPLLTHPRHGTEKSRKRRSTKDEDAELLKNPWAVMLASPARMCSVSGARVPSALLGTWGLVRKPDTNKLYMMPVGLLEDSLQSKQTQQPNSQSESVIQDQQHSSKFELPALQEGSSDTSVIPTSKSKYKQTGRNLVLRIAELLPLLRSITRPLSQNRGKRPAISRLLPFRWKHPQGPITAREEQMLIWSENTPDIVLHGMSQDVSKKLAVVLEKYKRVGAANGVWRALDMSTYSDAALKEALEGMEPLDRMSCGAVLLLRPVHSVTAGPTSQMNISMDSVALPQTGSKVPVFDLSALVSESDMKKLRGSHDQLQHAALFFRPEGEIGINAMISLWKLKRLVGNADPLGQ